MQGISTILHEQLKTVDRVAATQTNQDDPPSPLHTKC